MSTMGDLDPIETGEWVDALRAVQQHRGGERSNYLINRLVDAGPPRRRVRAALADHRLLQHHPAGAAKRSRPATARSSTGCARSSAGTRWRSSCAPTRTRSELGGHIASFQSAATLYDIGFGHFWHAPTDTHGGDLIFIQGHSSPGIYARAFLEGRLTEAATAQLPAGDRRQGHLRRTRTRG